MSPPVKEAAARHDAAALDAIASLLGDNPEWSAGMLEDVAAIVADTGRDVQGDGTVTWVRH